MKGVHSRGLGLGDQANPIRGPESRGRGTSKRIRLCLVGPHGRHREDVLNGVRLDKVVAPVGAHAVESDLAQGAEIVAHDVGYLAVRRELAELLGEASEGLSGFDLRWVEV